MKRLVKIFFYIIILASISLILFNIFFGFKEERAYILGNVIEFSEEQESKGNLISIVIVSCFLIGFMVVLGFVNIIENYLEKKRNNSELDVITGKSNFNFV